MRRGGDDVAVGQRIGMQSGGDESGDMGNVGHQVSAHGIGDCPKFVEVDRAGIGGVAADDDFWLVLLRQFHNGVVVEFLGFLVDAVLDDLEPFTRHVHRGTVGQVTAVGQIHAHNRVAGLEQGEEDGEVGLGTGVGLDVGMGRAEQFFDPIDGDLFDFVHEFAAAVVALAGQTFRVLVGQHRSLRRHHGGGGEILAGDQFQVILLALEFLANQGGDRGVLGGEVVGVCLSHGYAQEI